LHTTSDDKVFYMKKCLQKRLHPDFAKWHQDLRSVCFHTLSLMGPIERLLDGPIYGAKEPSYSLFPQLFLCHCGNCFFVNKTYVDLEYMG
jgi:hypothetical protein